MAESDRSASIVKTISDRQRSEVVERQGGVSVKRNDVEINLLPASRADAEELADLRVLTMRESLERIGRFDEDRARSRFLSSFDTATTRHIEVERRRIGFVVLTPQPEHLSLEHLYIHPDQQGAGTGSAVLALLFQEADDVGMSIRVGALKESDSNRFYTRHGFEFAEEGEFDNYYVRPAKTTRSI